MALGCPTRCSDTLCALQSVRSMQPAVQALHCTVTRRVAISPPPPRADHSHHEAAPHEFSATCKRVSTSTQVYSAQLCAKDRAHGACRRRNSTPTLQQPFRSSEKKNIAKILIKCHYCNDESVFHFHFFFFPAPNFGCFLSTAYKTHAPRPSVSARTRRIPSIAPHALAPFASCLP